MCRAQRGRRHCLAVEVVNIRCNDNERLRGAYLSSLYIERRRRNVIDKKRRDGDGKSVLHLGDDAKSSEDKIYCDE
jgi:hypothetical protein